jgi:hypothetical protein
MPVLYWLDVGIGYAFAMLLMATLTGAFVALVQAAFQSRTRWLADGLMSIIANLDPHTTKSETEPKGPFATKGEALTEEARKLAWAIVGDVSVKGGTQLAEVIGREELVLLLLRNAAIGADGEQGKLWKLCVKLTGQTPGDLLGVIQTKLVEMEQADPDAPAYLWRVRAIHAAGAGALAGRVFAWYDNTMRRVEDRINYAGRKWSVLFSLVLCAWMNVNSFDLLTKLQRDGTFREALAEMGSKAAAGPAPAPAAGAQTGDTPKAFEALSAEFAGKMDETTSILGLGGALQWKDGPGTVARTFAVRVVTPGIWLSAMMVSLGTAFWFGLLNRLVGLKSAMKEATERGRAEREADQRAPRKEANHAGRSQNPG